MKLISFQLGLMLLWIKEQHSQQLIQNLCSSCNINSRKCKTIAQHKINWNKYQSKITAQNAPDQYLDYLIEPSFQGVNILFVLAFNANNNRIGHSRYLPTEKVKDYVLIEGTKFLMNKLKMIQKPMKTFEKLRLLVVC